jgi:IMP dehydrogenase
VEGVKGLVPYKGHAQNIFNRLFEGLQSCCSYQGVDNLVSLRDSELVEITGSGLKESLPHDIILK